ncbi:MAG: protein kinase, partial [Candidatus Aminicenantes bacterium]|nr:protein kinase [Candidatus Aminicenantes bacterium]
MAVKCPQCHSEILDDSRFCSKCGMPIHATEEELAAFTKTLATPSKGVSFGSLLAGKYRLLEEIGHGGMGIVYKAEDMRLKRTVALKFLPPELSSNTEARERFLQEARAAAALSHPNICTIHEVDESEDKPFIAMEFVEGENLRERIKKGPLPIEEVLAITIEVAEGLEKAHQKGIVHRDIKSANIMVTESGQAKIMDFGLAKLQGGTAFTKEGATLGTVAYMSPEQARGEKVDGRTDIWSLGVVLYEMLTNELPFKGERDVSILYSIVHEEPKALEDKRPPIHMELQRVIEKALAKNTDSRYQSATEILKDLRGYRDAQRMESAGVFNLHSFLKRLKRPTVAIPSAIALIAVAAVVAWLLHRQAKIRWAQETLLPQIEQSIMAEASGRDNLIDAYKLVQEAEKYISGNPKLSELTSKCAVTISVETDPPGAQVSIKKYSAPDSEWEFLGTSPIRNIRLPMGIFWWKLAKEGFETVHATAFTYKRDESRDYFNIPDNLRWVLDKKGNLPSGMVRVAGGQVQDIGRIDDFYIDRFEVTNKQFKEFVDQGGYQKREFWKNPFVKDGEALSWEEAMAGFVDQTGRSGPSTWQAGAFPQGHEDYPVSGVSWYEAAAFAEFAGKGLPTSHHWDIARGSLTPLYQSGFLSILYPLSNFQGEGTAQVGKYQGLTAFGAYDMAGNVREWCWNETTEGRLVRGGAWNDINYMFGNLSQAPPLDRSPKNGFRCVQYLDRSKIPETAFAPIRFYASGLVANPSQIKPVPDPVFRVYKDQFSYDRRDLNARVESTSEKARD